ncbi:MAG: N-acetylmuramoyl-L-alanine amidase [Paracoccaceae bacterium]
MYPIPNLRSWAVITLAVVVLALDPARGAAQQDPSPQSPPAFSALARAEPGGSQIRDTWGGLEIALRLSQGVPYRLFSLDNPPRLVMDFREVDWSALRSDTLLNADRALAVRMGGFRPGWSRMVVELAAPMGLDSAAMRIDPQSGKADLTLDLSPRSQEAFAAFAGLPEDPRWDLPEPQPLPRKPALRQADDPLAVVIDAGHGGIDPGAQSGGAEEKHLTLRIAKELEEALIRRGNYIVYLTRDADFFVSLERRVAIAHRVGADVFISLHADALAEGLAHGASVHTLSDRASDEASALLAERHDRADMLSGVDLTGKDDEIAGVLFDLARLDTAPRSETLAKSILAALRRAGGPVNKRALRHANFSVLKAADIPSVLIEMGYMSSPRDLANLQNPQWRRKMVDAIAEALEVWRNEDAATAGLRRQ